METQGGFCGALAAGAADTARWVPEAVGALTAACAGAPLVLDPLGALVVGAAVGAVVVMAISAVAGPAGRRGLGRG